MVLPTGVKQSPSSQCNTAFYLNTLIVLKLQLFRRFKSVICRFNDSSNVSFYQVSNAVFVIAANK